METISLTAPDISCDHCKHTVETEVGALSGVQSVSVDVPTKRVNITYQEGAVSPAQIEAALEEAGYPVTV